MKLKILAIATMVATFGCNSTSQPTTQPPMPIIGDCTPQSCEELFTQVRSGFPDTVSKYAADCQGKQILGLSVFDRPGEGKRVNFACWSASGTDGSKTGQWLGVLPFPGEEARFSTSWNCSGSNCENIIIKLRQKYLHKSQKAEFECATKSGNLYFDVANSGVDKIEVECQFFVYELWDENGDGVTDGDNGTSVSYTIATFEF
ncbi:MAG: hypothetical protein GDA56_29685 [Hormoscilla sp. GM7CHS1pb]|nr:hypothetical protein [Hormoscilla sp. GM7CHS1pb]